MSKSKKNLQLVLREQEANVLAALGGVERNRGAEQDGKGDEPKPAAMATSFRKSFKLFHFPPMSSRKEEPCRLAPHAM